MNIEDFFISHDIRPTAVRILVWRTLLQFDHAFSLSELEVVLPKADRSSIFRSLSLFVSHELLHTLDDGSGQQKYCLHSSQHVHLTCLHCGRTICLENQAIPLVPVPEGFEVRHSSYVIQGICAKCKGHSSTRSMGEAEQPL